jgi:hypothetical protein
MLVIQTQFLIPFNINITPQQSFIDASKQEAARFSKYTIKDVMIFA